MNRRTRRVTKEKVTESRWAVSTKRLYSSVLSNVVVTGLAIAMAKRFSRSGRMQHKVEELEEKFRGLTQFPNSCRASSITHILGGMLINSSRPLECRLFEPSTEAEPQAICC